MKPSFDTQRLDPTKRPRTSGESISKLTILKMTEFIAVLILVSGNKFDLRPKSTTLK